MCFVFLLSSFSASGCVQLEQEEIRSGFRYFFYFNIYFSAAVKFHESLGQHWFIDSYTGLEMFAVDHIIIEVVALPKLKLDQVLFGTYFHLRSCWLR